MAKTGSPQVDLIHKAAFFDRDGTLITDVSYLSDLKQIELIPGIVDFCRALTRDGYELFVVTNQSGIARGFFDDAFVEKTHQHLAKIFKSYGVHFKQFYYCSHQQYQNCLCRKPSPGMLTTAAREHALDLSQSLMFGDKASDVTAGVRAGCNSFYIADALNRFTGHKWM